MLPVICGTGTEDYFCGSYDFDTIRRVQKDFMETRRRVINGEIGDIVSAHIIRNGGSLWVIRRKPEWRGNMEISHPGRDPGDWNSTYSLIFKKTIILQVTLFLFSQLTDNLCI